MIEVQQWRATIGRFCHPPSSKCRYTGVDEQHQQAHPLSDLCVRLFITAVLLWGSYLQHTTTKTITPTHINNFTHFCLHETYQYLSYADSWHLNLHFMVNSGTVTMNPSVNTLILAGDIESNPGPTLSQELQQVVDSINQNMNTKFDDMNRKIDVMGQSLAEVKTDVAKLNEKVSELERDMTDGMKDVNDRMAIIECGQESIVQDQVTTDETLASMADQIHKLEDELDRQEQYSRRENLLFHNIPLSDNESYTTMSKNIISMLNDYVPVKRWHESDIVRAHRNGRSTSDKPAPVIVRFSHFMDKLDILKARKDLHDQGIGVSNDLTKMQRQAIYNVKTESKGLKRAFYRKGQLVIVDNDPDQNYRPSHSNQSDTTQRDNSTSRDQEYNSRRQPLDRPPTGRGRGLRGGLRGQSARGGRGNSSYRGRASGHGVTPFHFGAGRHFR